MNETRRVRTDPRAVSGVRPYVKVMTSPEPTPGFLRLAALPTAPHLARVFVTNTARQWQVDPCCIEVAELLVSELVTNAVKQTGRVEGRPTPSPTELVAVVLLRVRLLNQVLRLDVWDNDQTVPVLAVQDNEAEAGRGLFLVDALAQRWGCYTPAGCRAVGKVVWAEVATSMEALHG